MSELEYIALDRVKESELIAMLNRQKIREHLMAHDLFDETSIRVWIQSKLEMDAIPGCRVRAIRCNHKLSGWCGIQLESGKYEIAVVLDASIWGVGKRVFNEIMKWAKEFELSDLYIHLLHTRPENRFLTKIAKNVSHSEIHGNKFTTYQLAVQ